MAYLASSDEEEFVVEEPPSPRWDREEDLFAYDNEGIEEKIEEISWPSPLPWVQTQTLTSTQPIDVDDVNDDLERELAFYSQALEAAKTAVRNFEREKVPWLRPTDYYAEMVKSDDHMAKIKEQLIYEQKKVEESEERRKTREAKKFQKQLQAAKNQEKSQTKKARLQAVTKLRKQRKEQGFEGDFDVDMALDGVEDDIKQKVKGINVAAALKSSKRQYKDAKYGTGGRKWMIKRNNAESSGDMDGFRGGAFSEGKRSSKKKNRPGKTRRAAMRGKKGAGRK